MTNLTLHLTSDTTTDNLVTFLERESKGVIKGSVAHYGQVVQTLMDDAQAQNLFVWTSPDLILPSIESALNFKETRHDELEADVDQFAGLVRQACKHHGRVFLMNWQFPLGRSYPIGLSGRPVMGPSDLIIRANIRLADVLADVENLTIIDLGRLLADFPENPYDARLEMIGKMRFSPRFLKYAANRLLPVILSTVVPARKVVICDLDNTLWGGIVGDDGIDNLRIGGNDGVGTAHQQVQKILKSLARRGILLAISSKNEENTALEAFRIHPNMVLKEDDFVAYRINWNNKAENIRSLLEELNLLPSGAVFLDDNPTERSLVATAFPELLVPDLPKDVAEWPKLIGDLACFETLVLTREDTERTMSYRNAAQRSKSLKLHANLDDWLKSLEISVTARPLRPVDRARTVQLLNKTNQFNNHTRRMPEEEFLDWCADHARNCFTFEVSDKFGAEGLSALVTTEKAQDGVTIVDFVMSCRVMGKGVEDAVLASTITMIGNCKTYFSATHTQKNGPARAFVERVTSDGIVRNGFVVPSHIISEIEP